MSWGVYIADPLIFGVNRGMNISCIFSFKSFVEDHFWGSGFCLTYALSLVILHLVGIYVWYLRV